MFFELEHRNEKMNEHMHSEYIIYGDESGDHSMMHLYKEHPVFVLALCVFSKREFVSDVVRNVKNLKFDFWGHDMTILHSAKLRRQVEDFQFLNNPVKRGFFINKLNDVIQNSPFRIISKGVDKRKLMELYSQTANPYELSLEFCIQNVYLFLREKQQEYRITRAIA